MVSIADPRSWLPADAAPELAAALHALAHASLTAATAQESDRLDARIRSDLAALIDAGDGAGLASAFASAPSAGVYRHLWRQLANAEAGGGDAAMIANMFALPVA